MVWDAVFDRPFDAARFYGFAVTDLFDAEGREDFEILERVAVYDDQVSFVADADSAESVFLTEDPGTVAGCVLDDLER